MKKTMLFLLLLSLLTVSVSARVITITNSTVFPVVTTTPGDTFCLEGPLVRASGNGITVNHSNCVFEFKTDDTLQFGASVLFNDSYGIRINKGVTGTVINNGNVIHKTSDPEGDGVGTEGGTGANCIVINWVPGATFNNVNTYVDGMNAHCVYIPGGMTKNIKFSGGTWVSNSNSFSSRETYGSAIFMSESFGYSLADNEWDVELINVKMLNSPHVTAVNKGRFLIDGCTLINDGRNVYWDTVYLKKGVVAPIGASFANPYNLLNRGVKPGSVVRNCYMGSGNKYGGGRGVLYEAAGTNFGGTATLPIVFENNLLDCHEGPDGENPGGTFRGLRIRGNLDYITFRNNQVFGVIDDDPATTAIGRDGTALHWGNQGGAHIIWENNTFEVTAVGPTVNGTARSAMLSGDAYKGFDGNTFSGSGYLVNFADMDNGVACSNWELRNCKFVRGSLNDKLVGIPNFAKFRTFSVGYSGRNSFGNVVSGGEYIGGASNTNIFFNSPVGQHDLKTKSKFKVTVTDNGLPKANFSVGLKNRYNQTVFQGLTDVNGVATGLMDFFFKATYVIDSVYSPYTLTYTGIDGVPIVKVLPADSLVDYKIGTKSNLPPSSPIVLTPQANEVLKDNVFNLTWQCFDPDGDSLYYDVWLGYTGLTVPKIIVDNSVETSFKKILGWDTAYFGYIRAFDVKGNATPSQVFYFSTPKQPDVNPPVVSNVNWSIVNAVYGDTALLMATITDDFSLKNVKVTFNEVGAIPVTVYDTTITGKGYVLNLAIPILVSKASVYEAVISALDTSGKTGIGISKELPIVATILYEIKGGFLYINGVRVDNITGEIRLLEKK